MRSILGFYIMFFTSITLAQGTIVELGELPEEISETSGLLLFDGRLITHNDSGNTAMLFEIDTVSRDIVRTVTITNATNTDWEAVSQDENYIYIGDFGNNVGTREDLTIFRIAKSDYLDNDTATAEAIFFSYEDQTDFTDTGNSDWDAEAFFILNDELIILTKQWRSQGSVAYAIPKTPGTYTAVRRDLIENIGLVTDADYNATSGKLVLLGYSTFLIPFVSIFTITESAIFSDTIEIIPLDIGLVQVEGLTCDGLGNCFISSELFTRQSPTITSLSRLFKFSEPEQEEEEQEEEEEGEQGSEPGSQPSEEEKLFVYREPSTGRIRYQINIEERLDGIRIYDVTGKAIWEQFDDDTLTEGAVFNF